MIPSYIISDDLNNLQIGVAFGVFTRMLSQFTMHEEPEGPPETCQELRNIDVGLRTFSGAALFLVLGELE